jgi:high-affinity nickel-transport protein
MGVIVLVVALLHIVGWGGVWLVGGPGQPTLVGLASLAYSFGLRHAFDADHIAAIDNTTRRLMMGGRRPLGVGLFFSLGHSTIVFVMTAAIVVATQMMTDTLPRLHAAGGAIGTTISGVFLYVIGFLNLIVLLDVCRVFRQMRRGETDAAAIESQLLTGGVVTRWFGGLFRLVERPWQMYLVGGLFGLGSTRPRKSDCSRRRRSPPPKQCLPARCCVSRSCSPRACR